MSIEYGGIMRLIMPSLSIAETSRRCLSTRLYLFINIIKYLTAWYNYGTIIVQGRLVLCRRLFLSEI